MSNPVISFRLPPYQLARGLWIVRKLEPAYKPTSISQLVKMLYIDYLAKMSYGRSNVIPSELINEIKTLAKAKKSSISITDILNHNIAQPAPAKPATDVKSESIITSVNDFTPPAEWLASLTGDSND